MCTRACALLVGIDLAQPTATVSYLRPPQRPAAPFTIAQTPTGFTALLQRLALPNAEPGRAKSE
jgi:hypothetical protein